MKRWQAKKTVKKFYKAGLNMTLYHITSGSYDEFGTFCFIEGPDGKAEQIDAAFEAWKASYTAFQQEQYALSTKASTEFRQLHGEGPGQDAKFGIVHAKYAQILNFGKFHALFAEAKKAEKDFLSARNSKRAEREAFSGRARCYIDQYVNQHRTLTNPGWETFLPEGCKVVEIETIHIGD